jgi:NAD(P)H-nitrite reductase large subunit
VPIGPKRGPTCVDAGCHPFQRIAKQAITGWAVGLETGGALLKQKIKVAVIEHNPRLLPRQTDPEGARILQEKMERMGFTFFLKAQWMKLGNESRRIMSERRRTIEGEMIIICRGGLPASGQTQLGDQGRGPGNTA